MELVKNIGRRISEWRTKRTEVNCVPPTAHFSGNSTRQRVLCDGVVPGHGGVVKNYSENCKNFKMFVSLCKCNSFIFVISNLQSYRILCLNGVTSVSANMAI